MNKKMFKNMLATSVGLACFSNAALADEITVWAWDPNFNVAIMEEAAKVYMKDHPETTFNVVDFAKEGANKRGNSSRLTQSFHFFMFEPIFSPVNALNQPI